MHALARSGTTDTTLGQAMIDESAPVADSPAERSIVRPATNGAAWLRRDGGNLRLTLRIAIAAGSGTDGARAVGGEPIEATAREER